MKNTKAIFVSIDTLTTCPNPSWIADGYCDDRNNGAHCDYDGGDCCVKQEINDTFCQKCLCHQGKGANLFSQPTEYKNAFSDLIEMEKLDFDNRCKSLYIGDGMCDDENNNEQCQYDLGDCCRPQIFPFQVCQECLCLKEESKDYEVCPGFLLAKGDNVCDDFMNNPECDYDDHDCCKPWAFLGHCDQCECHDPDWEF